MDKTKCVAALFDFDGVVMDTESQYSIFWNEVGKKYHPEYEEFGKIIKGQTLRQIYDRYFQGMEHEQAEITEGLNRFETEMRYEYVPGVAEFMQNLRARILTAEMFQKSKPDPDCFLLGAKVFETLPANCVVFEDSFHGIQAGNAAGMPVVGLSTTNPAEAIQNQCARVIPDFTCFTYEEMMNLL